MYNGAEGLRRAAMTAHTAAVAIKEALEAMGYKTTNKTIFDTVEVEAEAAVVQDIALAAGINFYYPSEGLVRLSTDEVTTEAEVETVVAIFAEAKGKKAKAVKIGAEAQIPAALMRESAILAEPVFNKYHSESINDEDGATGTGGNSFVALVFKSGGRAMPEKTARQHSRDKHSLETYPFLYAGHVQPPFFTSQKRSGIALVAIYPSTHHPVQRYLQQKIR